uniref:Putative ovule protein n=1 Tax=Solanum chacoense TaxID=4108 RepID=A0A0V0GNN1_SOLCH
MMYQGLLKNKYGLRGLLMKKRLWNALTNMLWRRHQVQMFSYGILSDIRGILKEDIINAIKVFHSKQTFEKSFNATFIVLIPKKPGASE